MSDELISAMVDKRAELQKLIAALQADVYHIDGALVALGRQNLVPLRHTPARRFANGELIALVGRLSAQAAPGLRQSSPT